MLLGDTNIFRLMTRSLQFEGDKLTKLAKDDKKAKNYKYLQQSWVVELITVLAKDYDPNTFIN